jgi:hypothetical protein
MSQIHHAGIARRRDGQDTEQIETEVSQVRQRLLAERLVMELGANQPEAAQRSGAGAEFGQCGGRECEIGADDDFLDLSPSGQQHRQRAADLQRELAHGFGQFNGQHLIVWDSASI